MLKSTQGPTSAPDGPENAIHEQYFGREHVTVIEPREGMARAIDLKELWAYRELVFVLTGRDIKVRYKQTVLGAAWAIIQPVHDDGRIFDLLRQPREDAVRRPPLSGIRLCRSPAMDVLCQLGLELGELASRVGKPGE